MLSAAQVHAEEPGKIVTRTRTVNVIKSYESTSEMEDIAAYQPDFIVVNPGDRYLCRR